MGEGNVQVQGGVGLLKLYAAKGRFEGASVGDEHSGGGGGSSPWALPGAMPRAF